MIDLETKAGDFVILLEKYNDLEIEDVIQFTGMDNKYPEFQEKTLGYQIACLESRKTTYKIYTKRIRKATQEEIVKAKLLGKFHE